MRRRCSAGSGRSLRQLLRLSTEWTVENLVARFPFLGGLLEQGAPDVATSRHCGAGVRHARFA
jgi:hypothetical protein